MRPTDFTPQEEGPQEPQEGAPGPVAPAPPQPAARESVAAPEPEYAEAHDTQNEPVVLDPGDQRSAVAGTGILNYAARISLGRIALFGTGALIGGLISVGA